MKKKQHIVLLLGGRSVQSFESSFTSILQSHLHQHFLDYLLTSLLIQWNSDIYICLPLKYFTTVDIFGSVRILQSAAQKVAHCHGILMINWLLVTMFYFLSKKTMISTLSEPYTSHQYSIYVMDAYYLSTANTLYPRYMHITRLIPENRQPRHVNNEHLFVVQKQCCLLPLHSGDMLRNPHNGELKQCYVFVRLNSFHCLHTINGW